MRSLQEKKAAEKEDCGTLGGTALDRLVARSKLGLVSGKEVEGQLPGLGHRPDGVYRYVDLELGEDPNIDKTGLGVRIVENLAPLFPIEEWMRLKAEEPWRELAITTATLRSIAPEGLAAMCELLEPGMIVCSINGEIVLNLPYREVMSLLGGDANPNLTAF